MAGTALQHTSTSGFAAHLAGAAVMLVSCFMQACGLSTGPVVACALTDDPAMPGVLHRSSMERSLE